MADIMKGIETTPLVSSGRPCIKGRGIIAEIVAGRFIAGESVHGIARDYELRPSEVESAIRFKLAGGEKKLWRKG